MPEKNHVNKRYAQKNYVNKGYDQINHTLCKR